MIHEYLSECGAKFQILSQIQEDSLTHSGNIFHTSLGINNLCEEETFTIIMHILHIYIQ